MEVLMCEKVTLVKNQTCTVQTYHIIHSGKDNHARCKVVECEQTQNKTRKLIWQSENHTLTQANILTKTINK